MPTGSGLGTQNIPLKHSSDRWGLWGLGTHSPLLLRPPHLRPVGSLPPQSQVGSHSQCRELSAYSDLGSAASRLGGLAEVIEPPRGGGGLAPTQGARRRDGVPSTFAHTLMFSNASS